MHSRVREVRKHFKLSQAAFGEKLGVSRDVISNIEANRVNENTLLMEHLCSVFGVNEHWLRTGEGEMLKHDSQSIIDRMTTEYDLSNRDRAVVSAFLELSAEDRAAITRYIDRLVSKFASNTSTDLDIDAETEAYRRELEAQKREVEKSSVSDMPSAKEA